MEKIYSKKNSGKKIFCGKYRDSEKIDSWKKIVEKTVKKYTEQII